MYEGRHGRRHHHHHHHHLQQATTTTTTTTATTAVAEAATTTTPLLTASNAKVGAGPELFRVAAPLAAGLAGEINPLILIGGAGAGPRRRVELFVTDVVASVAGVFWKFFIGFKRNACKRGRRGGAVS